MSSETLFFCEKINNKIEEIKLIGIRTEIEGEGEIRRKNWNKIEGIE